MFFHFAQPLSSWCFFEHSYMQFIICTMCAMILIFALACENTLICNTPQTITQFHLAAKERLIFKWRRY